MLNTDQPEPAFAATQLPEDADTFAPDGSQVRVLVSLAGGSAAHFRLEPGLISRAGYHRTVGEIWYILDGRGEMWRRRDAHEEVTRLKPGLCLTIQPGTSFQFRSNSDSRLDAFAVTIPPWPGDNSDEWVEVAPHWPVQL